MPQIKEYNRQVDAVGPTQTRRVQGSDLNNGGEGLQFAGKAISYVGDVVEKIQGQDDVIKVSKLTSDLYLKHTQKLDALRQSGAITDKDAYQKFNDEMATDFSKVGDEISSDAGRKLLAEKQSAYTNHFGGNFISEASQAKGAQAKNGFQSSINTRSSALVMKPDDFQHNIDDNAKDVDAMVSSGLINAQDGEALKQHGERLLADGAIRGYIQRNPYEAKNHIEDGKFDKYLNGDRKGEMLNMSETAIKGKEADTNRAKREQKDKIEQAAEAEIHSFLPKIYANEYTAKDVLASKTLNPQQQEHYVNLINKTANGEAKNHAGVENDTYKSILKGDIYSVDQITSLVGNGLDAKGASRLSTVLASRKDENGIKDSDALNSVYKEAEARMKNPVLGLTPDAQNRLNAFRPAMMQAFTEGRAKGLSTRELTDSKSPQYIGRMIDQYVPDTKEIFAQKMKALEDKKAAPAPAAPPTPQAPQTSPNGSEGLQTADQISTANAAQAAEAAQTKEKVSGMNARIKAAQDLEKEKTLGVVTPTSNDPLAQMRAEVARRAAIKAARK